MSWLIGNLLRRSPSAWSIALACPLHREQRKAARLRRPTRLAWFVFPQIRGVVLPDGVHFRALHDCISDRFHFLVAFDFMLNIRAVAGILPPLIFLRLLEPRLVFLYFLHDHSHELLQFPDAA